MHLVPRQGLVARQIPAPQEQRMAVVVVLVVQQLEAAAAAAVVPADLWVPEAPVGQE
jgi:hypothetical protein